VTGKDDVFIAFFFGKRKICVYIFIRIIETLIPGTDSFFLTRVYVDCFDLPDETVRKWGGSMRVTKTIINHGEFS
jgi:hypothetical protein